MDLGAVIFQYLVCTHSNAQYCNTSIGVAAAVNVVIGSGALYEAIASKLKLVQDVALMASIHGSDVSQETTQLEILTVQSLLQLQQT